MDFDPQLPADAVAASAGAARSPSCEDSAADELPDPSPKTQRHTRVEFNLGGHVLLQMDEKDRMRMHLTHMFDLAVLINKRRPERFRREAVTAVPVAALKPSLSSTSAATPNPDGTRELSRQGAAPAARTADVATAAADSSPSFSITERHDRISFR